MVRIASLVLLGGALIVLLGTRVDNTTTDESTRYTRAEAGQFPLSWIVIVLTISAVSFEVITTAPERFTVLTIETTAVIYAASHWMVAGTAAAALLALYLSNDSRRSWSLHLSNGLAVCSIPIAFYEIFILVPNL